MMMKNGKSIRLSNNPKEFKKKQADSEDKKQVRADWFGALKHFNLLNKRSVVLESPFLGYIKHGRAIGYDKLIDELTEYVSIEDVDHPNAQKTTIYDFLLKKKQMGMKYGSIYYDSMSTLNGCAKGNNKPEMRPIKDFDLMLDVIEEGGIICIELTYMGIFYKTQRGNRLHNDVGRVYELMSEFGRKKGLYVKPLGFGYRQYKKMYVFFFQILKW